MDRNARRRSPTDENISMSKQVTTPHHNKIAIVGIEPDFTNDMEMQTLVIYGGLALMSKGRLIVGQNPPVLSQKTW